MKLRLPNKLIAAIMAAATPVLFSTLSTATLGAAAVATLGQQAMAFTGPDVTYTGEAEITSASLTVGATENTIVSVVSDVNEDSTITISASGKNIKITGNEDGSGNQMLDLKTATADTLWLAGNRLRFRINEAVNNNNPSAFNNVGTVYVGGAQVWFTGNANYTGNNALRSNFVLGQATLEENANLAALNYSALRIGANTDINGNVTIDEEGSKISFQGSKTLTLNGALTGSGNLTLATYNNETGTLKLMGGTEDYTGTLTVGMSNNNNSGTRLVFSAAAGMRKTYALSNLIVEGHAASKVTLERGADVTLSGTSSRVRGTMEMLDSSTLTVKSDATLDVSDAGTNQTATEGLIIRGGALTVEDNANFFVGHKGEGQGVLRMSSGSITASQIGMAWGGTMDLSGGSLEITKAGNAFYRHNSAGAGINVLLRGSLVLKAGENWTVNEDATRPQGGTQGVSQSLKIGSVTIDGDNTGTITFNGATLIGGTIQNDGKLALSGTTTVSAEGIAANNEIYGERVASDFNGEGDYAGSGYLVGNATKYYLIRGGEASTLTVGGTLSGFTRDASVGTDKDLIVTLTAPATPHSYFINKDLTYDADVMGTAATLVVTGDSTLTVNSATVLNTALAGTGRVEYTQNFTGNVNYTADASAFMGTLALKRDSGNHSNGVTLSPTFAGTLEVKGRINLNGSDFGMAKKLVLNTKDDASNTTGFWSHDAVYALHTDLELTGGKTAELFLGAAVNLYGNLSSDADTTLKVSSGNTLYLNGAHNTIGGFSGGTISIAKDADLTLVGKDGMTLSGTISGAGSVIKTGNTTLTLSAGNNFTGDLTVSGGTLKMGAGNALGANNGGTGAKTNRLITIEQGATIDTNGRDNTAYEFILAGGSLVNNGTNPGDTTSHIQNSKLTLTADSFIGGNGSAFYMITNGWNATSTLLQNHTLTKTGSNTFGFYQTTITGGGEKGTLRVEGGAFKGCSTGDARSVVDANIAIAHSTGDAIIGDFIMNGGHSISSEVAGGSMSANTELRGATTLSADGTATLTLSGAISGVGSVSKTGSGAAVLSGNATYTGATTVTGGSLTYSNAFNGSSLDLSGDGTSVIFNGAATFSGNISASGGGTINVSGSSPVTANTITITNGTKLNFDRMVTLTGNARPNFLYGASGDHTGTELNFNGGYTYTGAGNENGYAMVIGSNVIVALGGTSTLGEKNIGMQAGALLKVKDGATLTVNKIYNEANVNNNGNISVGNNATLKTTANAGNRAKVLTIGSGSTTTFGGETTIGTLNATSGGTLNFAKAGTINSVTLPTAATMLTALNLTGDQKVTFQHDAAVSIGASELANGSTLSLHYNNDSSAAVSVGALTLAGDAATVESIWHGGVVNIQALSGEDKTLNLTNSGSSDRHTTFSLGSTDSTATAAGFSGTINLNHSNNGADRGTVLILNDEYTTSESVLKVTAAETGNARLLAIGLNSNNVRMLGLHDDDVGALTNASNAALSHYTLFSGSGSTLANRFTGNNRASYLDNAADGTTRTLELTGSGNYETSIKVDKNINLKMSGTGTQTFSGDVSGFNGQLTATSGILKIADATPTDGNVSTIATTGLHANGGIIASEGGAIVKITNEAGGGQLTIGNNGGFSVAGTGKLIVSPWWDFNMTALREDGTATMKATGDVANYAFSREDITISGAKVSYTAANGTPTVKHTFTNSTIVAAGSGSTLTVTNSANTLVGVDAEGGTILVQNAENSADSLESIRANGGNVTIQGLGSAVTADLNELFIADSRTVSMYQDDTTTESAEANVAVSGTLTAGNGATLNANLTMKGGSTIDVDYAHGGLTMGSTVTFEQGGKMNLSDDIITGLNSLTVGSGLTLFSGVDSFTIGGNTYSDEDFTSGSASNYFNLAKVDNAHRYDLVVKYTANAADDGGTVSLWMQTPEPATATLSLLALAGLAARRRRK